MLYTLLQKVSVCERPVLESHRFTIQRNSRRQIVMTWTIISTVLIGQPSFAWRLAYSNAMLHIGDFSSRLSVADANIFRACWQETLDRLKPNLGQFKRLAETHSMFDKIRENRLRGFKSPICDCRFCLYLFWLRMWKTAQNAHQLSQTTYSRPIRTCLLGSYLRRILFMDNLSQPHFSGQY